MNLSPDHIVIIIAIVLVILTLLSFVRAHHPTGTALAGMGHWVIAFVCFIAIAFDRPRRACGTHAAQALKSTGLFLWQLCLTVLWLLWWPIKGIRRLLGARNARKGAEALGQEGVMPR